MSKVSITTITNLTDNPSSATAAINLNFTRVQEVIDLLVSRDGAVPNAMLADLDMNANRVLNLPIPVSDTEPARHGDIQQYVDEAEAQADRAEAEADLAEISATAAQLAETEAEAALDEFQSLYLGDLTADPGDSLSREAGAIYFNTVENVWHSWAIDEIVVGTDGVIAGSDNVQLRYWAEFPSTTLRSLTDVNADSITNGQILQWNTAQEAFLPVSLSAVNVSFDPTDLSIDSTDTQGAIEEILDRTSIGKYDISFYLQGLMDNDERLYRMVASRSFSLPVGLSGSYASSRVAANSETVVSLRKNDVEFGTITFAAGATIGTLTAAGETLFNQGDILEIRAPAIADTALKDTSITLAAHR